MKLINLIDSWIIRKIFEPFPIAPLVSETDDVKVELFIPITSSYDLDKLMYHNNLIGNIDMGATSRLTRSPFYITITLKGEYALVVHYPNQVAAGTVNYMIKQVKKVVSRRIGMDYYRVASIRNSIILGIFGSIITAGLISFIDIMGDPGYNSCFHVVDIIPFAVEISRALGILEKTREHFRDKIPEIEKELKSAVIMKI